MTQVEGDRWNDILRPLTGADNVHEPISEQSIIKTLRGRSVEQISGKVSMMEFMAEVERLVDVRAIGGVLLAGG